jgi:uncharacterized membrane protein
MPEMKKLSRRRRKKEATRDLLTGNQSMLIHRLKRSTCQAGMSDNARGLCPSKRGVHCGF